MNFPSLNLTPKLIMISTLLVVLSACGGRTKPDRKDQPAAPVPAASGPIAPPAESAVDPNAEVGTEGATEKATVPYADQNTEYVGDVAQEVMNQKGDLEMPASKPAKSAGAKAVKGKKQNAGSLELKTSDVKTSPTVKSSSNSVPADRAMGWLKNGNTRYVKRRFRADGASAADRKRLGAGQHPHSVVFTCSDSRVPPEIVFDQKLGEIYVVRTDELIVNTSVLASFEKATALGAQLLVVLAHDDCPASAVKESGGITSQSKVLADLENNGSLKIQPASYDLKTGIVTFQ